MEIVIKFLSSGFPQLKFLMVERIDIEYYEHLNNFINK